MPFTSTSYENFKRREGRKIVCRVCKQIIPDDCLVCLVCEAPEPPEADPEKGVLSLPQTFLRAAVMVLIFSLIVVFKQDIKIFQSEPDVPTEVIEETEFVPEITPDTPVQTKAPVESYYIVNVAAGANIRAEPSIVAKKVAVLSMGTRVKILSTQNDWAQISADGVTGWVASRLIVTKDEALE